MALNEVELVRLIEVQLSVHGFKRNKKIWFLESEDCYSVLELDKGTWGGNFHLDLSVIIKAISIAPPTPNRGEILGWDIESLMPDPLAVKSALNLSDLTMTNSEKEQVIVGALQEYAIPFLKRIRTIEGLKDELIQNKRMRYHTSLALWNYLDMDVSRNPKLD